MAQLVFVRHGNDNKAPVDDQRLLTHIGEAQSLTFRDKARDLGLSPFDLVLCSPKTRTKQTAVIIAPGVTLIELPELSTDIPGEDGALLNETYARLKYAPLGVYLLEPGMTGVMMRYGHAAHMAIDSAVAKAANPDRVLVVGHAVLLNAIGWYLTRYDIPNVALLSITSLGECEGLYIKEDGKVEIITNP